MIIDSIFSGPECTLSEILNSRENRVETYNKLKAYYGTKNVVILCINMPGCIKKNPASDLFFLEGSSLLQSIVENPVFIHFINEKTGPELFIGTNLDPLELKKKIVKAEVAHGWYRMLDIDVIDENLGHISRTRIGYEPLSCFVCGKNAKECSSRETHSEKEIKAVITDYYTDLLSYKIGKLASDSLIREALCTPKPGLVDRNNNGSHKDMNLDLFLKSSEALQPYFVKMCKLGFLQSPISHLRKLGQDAENAMYEATGGINTHKGAIFCLGFLSYSYGYCISNDIEVSAENICSYVKEFTSNMGEEVPENIKAIRGLGARGQAMNGYEVIIKKALPFYRTELMKSDENRALSLTLLLILSQNEDSNVISRSDAETLRWAQKEAAELFKTEASEEKIEELDKNFIEKNISPGGSADLLSATYFLADLPRSYYG